jgi:5'-nucleotidase
MPYPIEKKLVVAVSTNALFNLENEDNIFKLNGLEAFKRYQEQNKSKILERGLAFPFIRRFLNINKEYHKENPVEVVLLSKNNPDISIRIFNSIRYYDLDITRAAFTSGESPFSYIPAFNVSLFLSTNEEDVMSAITNGFAAGRILNTKITDDLTDNELRVAFDFDGVIADDESEKIYKEHGQLDIFHDHETVNKDKPLNPGPLADFFKKLAFFQKMEEKKKEKDSNYKKIVKTSIITARNAPAHERALNTLKSWNVEVDEMYLLGGIEKKRVLEVHKPHIFFDDQISHLDATLTDIPLVHIPLGISNNKKV